MFTSKFMDFCSINLPIDLAVKNWRDVKKLKSNVSPNFGNNIKAVYSLGKSSQNIAQQAKQQDEAYLNLVFEGD